MSTPRHHEALILQMVHGNDIWTEIGDAGVMLCAATRKKSRSIPGALSGGSWYKFSHNGTEVLLQREGESGFNVPAAMLEEGVLSSTFLFPVARFSVPIKPIENAGDVRALQKGDTLVALRRTIEDPAYADAAPLTHEKQFCFVSERTARRGGEVEVKIGGLPLRDDPTDFSATYKWSSEKEDRAHAGNPADPTERFPLGTFFAKVEWPTTERVEPSIGANVNAGDYLVGGPQGFEKRFAIEPGEVASVTNTVAFAPDPKVFYHANGGRDQAAPKELTDAGILLVPGQRLRVPLTPDRFRHLATGTYLWASGTNTRIAQGARCELLVHDHTLNEATIRETEGSKNTFKVAYSDADGFEVDPEAEPSPPAATAPSNRVLLTPELARLLKKGDSLWATATSPLPAGTRVDFESFARGRLAWISASGKQTERAGRVVDEGWFEVDPSTLSQATLPIGAEPRVPLTRAGIAALQAGNVLVGAVDDAKVGVTAGKEYTVKNVDRTQGEPIVVVSVDGGADASFGPDDASALFDLKASSAPPDAEDDDDAPAPPSPGEAPAPSPASALPADPKEAKEEEEYRRELVRDRPLKGPTFRHRQRVLNAMRRLLGEPSAGGLYTPGLYALAEYGPTFDLLRAGWLVRDGSTMLMGIAGTGKTTFIKYGTRLLCGAPPRLVDEAKYAAIEAEPDRKTRRDLLASLRVGTLRIDGQVIPATTGAFDRLIAHQKGVRREAWMIPADEDAALRIERRRRLGKRPPTPIEEPHLYMEGRSEHVIAAWAIHDAVNAPAMLTPDATSTQRRQADDAASAVTDAQAAWYRETFNAFFDYFATTFIGEAKSDPEKQPDEVLYKTKVLNVTYPDVARIQKSIPDSFGTPEGSATETVIFPEAQPIVTAPVKFVNETNRMSRALGDAFLGLLAEKEIEYRGQKFRSPDSLWWFDMNPHLGWGTLDWAFLDRIDVSIIIPAINLSAKLAYEDSRLGRRRAQEAAFVYEAPEFSLDELNEVWRDVEAVDVGGYWPDDSMSDLADIGVALPSEADRKAGHPSVTYDPIYALRFSAAMLEAFVATPDGFDFSRFVSHPMKGPDPHDPRSGAGEHWEHLYERMLSEQSISRDDVASMALYAKLQRPFGFRAQASLRKYAKAVAWLRGSPRVELEDVLAVLPFVLNHRLAVNYEEANMQQYFSVYDWLTHKNGAGDADGTAQGQIENIKDRLTVWEPALAQLYKLQIVHALMVAPESAGLVKPAEYNKIIALAKGWVGPDDKASDDKSIAALAEQAGAGDGVLRQIATEAKSLLLQIEQEKDYAIVRTLPERVQARKFTRKDVEEWEDKLGVFLARAGNRKQEREIRDAIEAAKKYLDLDLHFVGDGMVGTLTAHDLDLDDEARYSSIVGTLIALVPDVDKKSNVLGDWRVAEKDHKAERAKGTDPTTLKPVELKLPKVGMLRIAFDSAQPPHKVVRVAFDNAQAAKKARSVLKKDFGIDVE